MKLQGDSRAYLDSVQHAKEQLLLAINSDPKVAEAERIAATRVIERACTDIELHVRQASKDRIEAMEEQSGKRLARILGEGK